MNNITYKEEWELLNRIKPHLDENTDIYLCVEDNTHRFTGEIFLCNDYNNGINLVGLISGEYLLAFNFDDEIIAVSDKDEPCLTDVDIRIKFIEINNIK